jgi:zinc finger (C-x8-C-x5-C-x3-H type) protein/Nab2-type zinc finger RNA-binding protein
VTDTSHVPCKFWRNGTCQAGKACPFLHGDVSGPCKYYQKGNCKFGLRCANEHITADGRRINKPAHLLGYNLGGRVLPNQIPQNSLLAMQHDQFMQSQVPPMMGSEEYMNYVKHSQYDIPTIDTTVSSLPGSAYGSPQNESLLGKSPAVKGLSALDAPLPASFESQGISIYARTGPIASSVPARLGFDSSSPPSSLPINRPGESSALRNLHSSAFGDDKLHNKSTLLGSSPSVPVEDSIGRRIMHSERFSSRPKMLSSSLGARGPLFDKKDDEWDSNFVFEEDLLPNTLNDLLTPQERLRRFSRSANDEEGGSNHRAALSGIGTPSEATSPKLGSPLGASPSRFGPLFARQQREKAAAEGGSNGSEPVNFGHVGSPLRPSLLNPGSSPSLRPASSRPTSGEFHVSSPPRQASMSMISQQLQRARLSSRASETSIESVGGISAPNRANSSSSSIPIPPPRLQDRSVSTGSSVGISRSEKIDEEPALFTMDEVDAEKWKRLSSGSKSAGVIGQRGQSNGNL